MSAREPEPPRQPASPRPPSRRRPAQRSRRVSPSPPGSTKVAWTMPASRLVELGLTVEEMIGCRARSK